MSSLILDVPASLHPKISKSLSWRLSHANLSLFLDLQAVATWEVDESGSLTGILFSMYLLSAGNIPLQGEKEISISYGDKGNEYALNLEQYEVAQQLRNKLTEV
ncbi:SET domain-containing protein [Perilla frutescens var. hirtella]|nr:SET domain-containing protein [Perilla frutescens var. hirtella]